MLELTVKLLVVAELVEREGSLVDVTCLEEVVVVVLSDVEEPLVDIVSIGVLNFELEIPVVVALVEVEALAVDVTLLEVEDERIDIVVFLEVEVPLALVDEWVIDAWLVLLEWCHVEGFMIVGTILVVETVVIVEEVLAAEDTDVGEETVELVVKDVRVVRLVLVWVYFPDVIAVVRVTL